MKAALQHPSTCAQCGKAVPYLGRRDLLHAMVGVVTLLEPVAKPDELSTPESNRSRGALAWSLLRDTLDTVNGRCPECQHDNRRQPEKPTLIGHCTVCAKEGVGIGPAHRCPVLGCAGSIALG